jgi:hypothetical protein
VLEVLVIRTPGDTTKNSLVELLLLRRCRHLRPRPPVAPKPYQLHRRLKDPDRRWTPRPAVTMLRAAGTDGPMGTVPLFTPMLPPMIESVSHEALVKWKRDRRDYEAKMQARCRVTGEDYNAVVQSVRDSFNPSLLDVFCELNLSVESANATEGMLIAEIERIVSSIKNNTLPDIEELFDRLLKMNMNEGDVNARLIDYYKTFNSIVADHGLTECFTGANGAKQKCKVLIANLLPKSLRDEVKQCLRFTHADAASDARALFRLVLEKAHELERQHQRLRLQRRETARPADKEKPRTDQSKKPKRRWESKKPAATADPSPATKATDASRGKSDSKSKPSSSSRPPPGPCPKCDELHWLRECPQATRRSERSSGRRCATPAKARRPRPSDLVRCCLLLIVS